MKTKQRQNECLLHAHNIKYQTIIDHVKVQGCVDNSSLDSVACFHETEDSSK
jgi:hypothetical protein